MDKLLEFLNQIISKLGLAKTGADDLQGALVAASTQLTGGDESGEQTGAGTGQGAAVQDAMTQQQTLTDFTINNLQLRQDAEVAHFQNLIDTSTMSNEQLTLVIEEHHNNLSALRQESSTQEVTGVETKKQHADQVDEIEKKLLQKKLTKARQEIHQVQAMVHAIGDSINNAFTAQEKLIDEEAAKKRKHIENIITAADKKAKAIQELESETQRKKKELKLKQFKVDKITSLVQTIINTALAVTAALSTQSVLPLSIIIAALAAATRAAQIAVIASKQPPSFATGIDLLPEDTFALLHKGERVIPAGLNIPEVSNENFANAALEGLNLSTSDRTINSTTNNTTTSNADNKVINITINGIEDPAEFVNKLKQEYGLEVFG